MLIHNPQDQIEQVHKNTYLLLSRIGSTTGYIDTETTQKILNITRQGATKYLNRATSWGLLKKHSVQMMNLRKRSIYGITASGVDYIIEKYDYFVGEYSPNNLINLNQLRPWSISRFRSSTHKHEMVLIKSANILMDEVESTIHPLFYAYSKRKADFGFIDKNRVFQAYEIELTIKSRKRYKHILWAYRKHFGIHKGNCYWITTTTNHANRMISILNELEEYYRNRHIVKLFYEKKNLILSSEEYIEELKREANPKDSYVINEEDFL